VTDVKVCGLTRAEDVAAACALGAAYVGFNFSSRSPRRVRIEGAELLGSAVTPGVRRVGVFVDEDYGEIAEAVDAASLDLVQIHRPLVADDVESIPRPILAVAHAGDGAIPPVPLLERCAGILVDACVPGVPGGTGVTFDWSLLEGRAWPVALFVAGGLTPENVAASISRTRPAAVDVASGVESSPGIKDRDRMRRFFDAVRDADRTR
jgi:phosphoribosylanthranilate isomerase